MDRRIQTTGPSCRSLVVAAAYGRWVRAFADLVAPSRCLECGVDCAEELCGSCAEAIDVLSGPLCRRCGGPSLPSRCACANLGGFDRACSLVAYGRGARSLTLELKRRGNPRLAAAMGGMLADLVRKRGLFTDATHLTFVPGGGKSKGFDHAEMLAGSMARRLGRRLERLLVRRMDGPRQADVEMDRRWSNVAGRFAGRRVSGRVLLVDDVFTTGATVESCAQALRRSGASAVDVVTWARTIRLYPGGSRGHILAR